MSDNIYKGVCLLLITAVAFMVGDKTSRKPVVDVFDHYQSQEVKETLWIPKEAPRESQHKIYWCKNSSECRVLAEAGYHEARGERDMGVVAVMQVIINRKNAEGLFKNQNTIRDVIYAPKQFSYTHDGSLKQKIDRKQMDRMKEIAYDVLHMEYEDVTNGSLYYHARWVTPYWAEHFVYTYTIGSHLFYR